MATPSRPETHPSWQLSRTCVKRRPTNVCLHRRVGFRQTARRANGVQSQRLLVFPRRVPRICVAQHQRLDGQVIVRRHVHFGEKPCHIRRHACTCQHRICQCPAHFAVEDVTSVNSAKLARQATWRSIRVTSLEPYTNIPTALME